MSERTMPTYSPAWKRLDITLRAESADAPKDDQVFRFLDLPAEMRNLVRSSTLLDIIEDISNANRRVGVSRTPRVAQR